MDFNQIKKGKNNITKINEEIIDRLVEVKMFENEPDKNKYLLQLHKELLKTSMNKNNHFEVGFLWNIDTSELVKIFGSLNGISIRDNEYAKDMLVHANTNSLVFMHNHPRNGMFSTSDLSTFISRPSLYGMTAVCNDGTIHTMFKTDEFNLIKFREIYNANIGIGSYSGIKSVTRVAKKVGLVYRCSVKRRYS